MKAFSIILLSAACAIVSAKSVKVHLKQHAHPTSKQAAQADAHRLAHLKSGSKIIPAINAVFSYYIEVDIGTPAQKTELLFDTGSSLLWVADSQYVATKSSSAKDQDYSQLLEYGSGNVTIEMYNDNVGIAGYKFPQTLGVAGNTSAIGVNGIIGFGPTDLAGVQYPNKTVAFIPTPMDNLYKSKKISTEVVGVDFRPIWNGAQQVANGEIDIGGIDSSKFKGKLTYIPISKKNPAKYYWGVDVSSITFGDFVAASGKAGIVDTGTTLITVQPAILQKLFSKVPGAVYDPNSELWTIPKSKLNKLKDITFHIGGKPFTLTPSQYVIPQNQYKNWQLPTGGVHYTYFSSAFLGDLDAIIGQKFLENFYSVFDSTHNRVGLAPRK